MKKILFYITLIASLSSLIISIITLCSFESYNPDKTSTLLSGFSVVTSALATLVAILIGWQIYNVINLKNVREESIKHYDDAIHNSNRNLLIIVSSLADYYAIQYLDTDINDEPEKANVLFFGTLLYYAITMDMSVELNEMSLFNSSTKSSNLIIGDLVLSNEQRNTILNILTRIPDSWRTNDFIELLNYFTLTSDQQ